MAQEALEAAAEVAEAVVEAEAAVAAMMIRVGTVEAQAATLRIRPSVCRPRHLIWIVEISRNMRGLPWLAQTHTILMVTEMELAAKATSSYREDLLTPVQFIWGVGQQKPVFDFLFLKGTAVHLETF